MLHYDSVAKAGNCVLLSPLTVLEERSAVRFAFNVLDCISVVYEGIMGEE